MLGLRDWGLGFRLGFGCRSVVFGPGSGGFGIWVLGMGLGMRFRLGFGLGAWAWIWSLGFRLSLGMQLESALKNRLSLGLSSDSRSLDAHCLTDSICLEFRIISALQSQPARRNGPIRQQP